MEPNSLGHPQIRKAVIEDADALVTCIDAAYAGYTKLIPDLPPVSEGCAEDISHNQVWVAIIQDQIVGGLSLVIRGDTIKLANVFVDPSFHGHGLGSELIALAENEAKKQGYTEIRLNTHAQMPDNIALYTHLGWEDISRDGNTISMRKYL